MPIGLLIEIVQKLSIIPKSEVYWILIISVISMVVFIYFRYEHKDRYQRIIEKYSNLEYARGKGKWPIVVVISYFTLSFLISFCGFKLLSLI